MVMNFHSNKLFGPYMTLWIRMVVVFFSLGTLLVQAHAAPSQNIADMRVGKAASVKARIGERFTAREVPGTFVFTMRDDFGATALAFTQKDITDLHFGATYVVTGVAKTDPKNPKTLYLEASSWEPAYTSSFGPVLMVAGGLAIVVIAGFVYFGLRLRQMKTKEPWDYAEILSGPDQGNVIPLRHNKIIIGRQQDPEKSISIAHDSFVSREHGVLTRKNKKTFYEDTNSRAGSYLDEVQLEAGLEVVVLPGSLLRVGPHTVIRIGQSVALPTDTSVFEVNTTADPKSWRDTTIS